MELKALIEDFNRIERAAVQSERAVQIISWDWRAMTPKAAAPGRAETIGAVADLNFAVLTGASNRKTLEALSQPENLTQLSPTMAARVKELKKQSDRKAAIPPELFSEFTRLQALSEAAWEKAKRENDWPSFAPHLQNMFDYTNRLIDLWGYEGSRYNALLGFNEEGMTTEKLDALFNDLRDGIVPLIRQVRQSPVVIDDSFVNQDFPVEQQRLMAHTLLQLEGFREDRGVLAESEHPYTPASACRMCA